MIPPPQQSNGWVTRILNSTSPIEIEGLGTVDGMCWMFHVREEDGQRIDITTVVSSPRFPKKDNVKRILTELLKLIDVPLPLENQFRVMYMGAPQSGKSLVQFIMLWYSCFVLEKGTIHLLMNRMDSLLQNISRDYIDLCEKIKNICALLDIPDYDHYLFDYMPFPEYAINQSVFEANSVHTVYCAMQNVCQMTKVKELDLECRQIIVLDESDVFINKDDNKPVISLTREILDEAEYRFECTATPFSNFNEIKQVYDSVVIMPVSEKYRGYNSDKIIRHIKSEEQIDNLTGILEDIFTTDTGTFKNITLVNVDSNKICQENIAKKIESAFPFQVNIIIINSENYYKHPISHMMNNIVNDTLDKRPVVLISGLMASRAVTFRTSKRNKIQGILTAMVYSPAAKAHQTTLMQAMRIFGNYELDYPTINVYWSQEVDNAIQSSFANNMVITKSIEPGKESRKCIEEVPVTDIKGRKFSSSDDCKFEKLENIEFKSPADIWKFMADSYKFTHEVITTISVKMIPVPAFTYDNNVISSQRSDIRKEIKKLQSGGAHVAWSSDRYNQLFSIKNRLAHPHYKVASITAGNPFKNGNQVKIPCVIWKEEYKDVGNWNKEDTIYMFRTTRGTWKAWIPGQMNTFRRIDHV